MAKNLPCNPGDVGSIPGQGTKILPASGKLSLCALQLPSLPATTGESMGFDERPHMTERRSCVLQLRPKAVK